MEFGLILHHFATVYYFSKLNSAIAKYNNYDIKLEIFKSPQLNDIIENYVNTNYGQLLNQNVSEDDNGTKEKLTFRKCRRRKQQLYS